jgi:hypothetical protein
VIVPASIRARVKPAKATKIARDEAVAGAWAFHHNIVGVKDSVSAQYGKDSNELQSVGRKKTTEYKKPARKASKPGAKQ